MEEMYDVYKIKRDCVARAVWYTPWCSFHSIKLFIKPTYWECEVIHSIVNIPQWQSWCFVNSITLSRLLLYMLSEVLRTSTDTLLLHVWNTVSEFNDWHDLLDCKVCKSFSMDCKQTEILSLQTTLNIVWHNTMITLSFSLRLYIY